MDFFNTDGMRFWIFILMFLSFSCFGQEYRSSLSSSEVRVGDRFTLSYEVLNSDRFPNTIDSARFFPAILLSADSLLNNSETATVEIISVSDTVIKSGVSFVAVRSYDLMAWDSCALSLVGFKYAFEGQEFHFPPCFINVSYYEAQEGVPLRDIKEYFNEWKSIPNKESEKNMYWPYILAFLFCSIAFFMWVWFRRRSRQKSIDFQKSLQDITLEKIEILRRNELWRKDSLQEHFVRFSHILRSYLTGRFGLSFLDKTTEQSKLILLGLSIDDDLRENIQQLLESADMVKFADSSIDDRYIFVLFEELIAIVNETSSISEES